jgi:hypothetical protein
MNLKTFFILGVALFFQGCAIMTFLDSSQEDLRPVHPPLFNSYEDYRGIIHIHTNYSHDSRARYEDIVDSAQKANADFIITTEHNNLRALYEKKEGVYKGVLLLISTELSTSAGHLAFFNIQKELNRDEEPEKILANARALGATRFICHGELTRHPWKDWSLAPDFTGMEIYNLPTDAYEDNLIWLGLKSLFLPPRPFYRSIMDRPEKFLTRWDTILAKQKFVGIGGVDAHQKLRLFGKSVDRCDTMFEAVQTHVWAKSLSKHEIYDALEKGHAYVAFDIVKPVRNFLFAAESEKDIAMMGDDILYEEGIQLLVYLPEKAEIRILKNGEIWKSAERKALQIEADGAGVYRVEVYLKNRLWIISNPIYITK